MTIHLQDILFFQMSAPSTPTKRKTTDLKCYVHAVSPLKKNKHFRINLQTNSGFKQAICYDTGKYGELVTKCSSGDPVHLEKLVLYNSDQKSKYMADFVLNRSSSIQDLDTVNVGFERVELKVLYSNLSSEFQIGDIVNVKGFLDAYHIERKTVVMEKRVIEVANDRSYRKY